MNNMDPFEVPPLVEWENCITHDEIVNTIKVYSELLQKCSKWRCITRWKIRMSLSVLESLDLHIHIKQNSQRRNDETVN